METATLEILVRNHAKFLGFLAKRVRDRDAAEEILQSAYLKGVEKRGTIRKGESSVAWFYRLLRNALTDHFRRQAVESRALRRVTKADVELERAICACVRALAGTLKPEYASLLKAVDLEGRDLAGAARMLSITPNNAAVRLHRARLALKRQLEISCGTCTKHGCLECTCA